mgnify:CR=1 FL=1
MNKNVIASILALLALFLLLGFEIYSTLRRRSDDRKIRECYDSKEETP